MQGYVYDIEADNLYIYSSKIWILHAISLDGTREFTLFPYEMEKQDAKRKFLEWHNSFGPDAIVSSFNGIGFDHWVLWKYLDIPFHIGKGGKDWLDREIPVKIIDLLLLSQMIDPDRPSHSLASYGEQFGDPKIEFDAFHQYSDEMLTYCKQDVKLTLKVFNYLVNKLQLMYRSVYKDDYDEDNPPYQAGLRALHKDYYLYAAQEITGIKFNQDKARKLLEDCAAEMKALEDEVLPQLPPRKLKEGEKKHYSLPAKPFKKDGSLSSTMEKWLTKHSAVFNAEENTVHCYGRDWPVVSNFLMDIKLPMEVKDGDDIKQWLMGKGWSPTFWNFKRDPETGKPMRGPDGEVITTSPKIQEAGKICPNLLEIDGELPKKIVKFLSLRNRASVVTGWLENPRLAIDGKIGASITGYTPTFRVKHNVIVNLPKASPEVVKGFEMRDLFEADEGRVYVSADAAALENRAVSDYTFEFDNGKFAELVLNGDSHSFNATLFYPEETSMFDITSPEFSKDDPKFKPFRNKAKQGSYALAYGASCKKLTKTLGVSEEAGQIAYDNYWDGNPGLKAFKLACEDEWKNKGLKKYILGRDGKILSARSKHLLVNLKGQNLGATVMTYAFCLMDNRLGWLEMSEDFRPHYTYKGQYVARCAAFHDQGDFVTDEGISEEVGQMLVQCIVDAGELLNMKVPLAGEYKIGKTAAEIH